MKPFAFRYFNDAWNKAWLHGIPKHDTEADGEIGPRMSIALLCAEADPAETLARLMKTGPLPVVGAGGAGGECGGGGGGGSGSGGGSD